MNIGIKIMNWNYSVSVGDLVRVFDPDREKINGSPYSTVGLVLDIQPKSPHKHAWRIFHILAEGEHLVFDEPFWAAEVLSTNHEKK